MKEELKENELEILDLDTQKQNILENISMIHKNLSVPGKIFLQHDPSTDYQELKIKRDKLELDMETMDLKEFMNNQSHLNLIYEQMEILE